MGRAVPWAASIARLIAAGRIAAPSGAPVGDAAGRRRLRRETWRRDPAGRRSRLRPARRRSTCRGSSVERQPPRRGDPRRATRPRRRLDACIALLRRPDVDYVSVKVSAICEPARSRGVRARRSTRSPSGCAALYGVAARRDRAKFVNLDMEEYRDLDLTVAAFRAYSTSRAPRARRRHRAAGLPARLARGARRARRVGARAARRAAAARIKVRLVKGANLAMERVEAELHGWPQAPYETKAEVDANYKRMLDAALDPALRRPSASGVASHNLFDVAWAHRCRAESLRQHATVSRSRCSRAWPTAQAAAVRAAPAGCSSTRRSCATRTSTRRSPTSSAGWTRTPRRENFLRAPVSTSRRAATRWSASAAVPGRGRCPPRLVDRVAGRSRDRARRLRLRRRSATSPTPTGRAGEPRLDRPTALAAPPTEPTCRRHRRSTSRRWTPRSHAPPRRRAALGGDARRPTRRRAIAAAGRRASMARAPAADTLATMAHDGRQDRRSRATPRSPRRSTSPATTPTAPRELDDRSHGARRQPLGTVVGGAAVELPARHPRRRRARRARRRQRRDPQAGARGRAPSARSSPSCCGRPACRATCSSSCRAPTARPAAG